jgi:SH3-like domain-containing protein
MKRKVLFSTVFLFVFCTVTFAAERMSIGVPMANVRSGPGDKSKVVWKLEKFHPLNILKTQGEWCYFEDFEGDKGWIQKSMLSKDQTVIVIKNDCNVRKGPGTDQKVAFTAEKGVPFKVIKKQGDWLQIRHADGDEGWINKSMVW